MTIKPIQFQEATVSVPHRHPLRDKGSYEGIQVGRGQNHFGITLDDRQDVVEVVGHPPCETPDRFLTLVSEWLHPARERLWTNGLRALLPLIGDSAYENLPPVFALVAPVIEAAPAMLQTDLLELIRALYAASPTETTYFLKKLLTESENPHTRVLMRRILNALPEELALSLRDLIRRR